MGPQVKMGLQFGPQFVVGMQAQFTGAAWGAAAVAALGVPQFMVTEQFSGQFRLGMQAPQAGQRRRAFPGARAGGLPELDLATGLRC